MRTELPPEFAATPAGAIAERVLRSCVHCGMCNATCPTYLLTGDELDGPRGRIYLIKQMLERQTATDVTRVHLDRCLGCRACETTCPSGVEYHKLYEVGRHALPQYAVHSWRERTLRSLIRNIVPFPSRLQAALRLARIVRQLLPTHLRLPEPSRAAVARSAPAATSRTMLLLTGCVQSVIASNFNAATQRVFGHLGIRLVELKEAGCCGALQYHLDAAGAARQSARRNIDAWWGYVERGAEAIVVNASGCASHIREYGALLVDDGEYCAKAERIAALVRDPVEILGALDIEPRHPPVNTRIAVHEPCTQQHALRLSGRVSALLHRLGYEPQPVRDAHLCCGSAGAYSLLQPRIAARLRDDKLAALTAERPEAIYTGNIGCWAHLGQQSAVPVRHWIEAVDEVLR